MSVGTDLISFLSGSTSISTYTGNQIHQNKIPQHASGTRVFFVRSGEETPASMDGGTNGLKRSEFDIECISQDLDDSLALADAVRNRLDQYRGTFGSSSIQGAFVNDKSDDYEPRGLGEDEGAFVTSLTCEIWHSITGE